MNEEFGPWAREAIARLKEERDAALEKVRLHTESEWFKVAANLVDARAEIWRLRALQPYVYIGKDGKPVKARDLEDQRDEARDAVARLRAELSEVRKALLEALDQAEDGIVPESMRKWPAVQAALNEKDPPS